MLFNHSGIYDILTKPVTNQKTADPTTAKTSVATASGTASASPLTTATSGTKLSEEIKMSTVTLYGVQLGVYSKLENAQSVSDQFRKNGSAGYILRKTRFIALLIRCITVKATRKQCGTNSGMGFRRMPVSFASKLTASTGR